MRLNEIASAEEQLELWKLISSSVWQSLQQQQSDEQKRRTAAALKKKPPRKSKPKRKGRARPSLPPLGKPLTPTPPPQSQLPPPAALASANSQPPRDLPTAAASPSQAPVEPSPRLPVNQPQPKPTDIVKQAGKQKKLLPFSSKR